MLARTLPEWLVNILGLSYPTSAWRRQLPAYLDVDHVRGALCGVAIGDSIEGLSFLGCADSANEAAMGVLGYSALGMELSASDGKLGSITLLLTGSEGAKHKPFEGLFRVKSNRHVIPAETTEAEALALFGEPTARAEQQDDETGEVWETSLRYVNGPVLCEVVFNPDGKLIEVNLEPAPEAETGVH